MLVCGSFSLSHVEASWLPVVSPKVRLFVSRICQDWDQLPEKLRKPLTFKDGVLLHQSCGMFLHFLDLLEARAPAAEFKEISEKLMATFMGGVMDPELVYAAEHSVPPGDVNSIGPFRCR